MQSQDIRKSSSQDYPQVIAGSSEEEQTRQKQFKNAAHIAWGPARSDKETHSPSVTIPGAMGPSSPWLLRNRLEVSLGQGDIFRFALCNAPAHPRTTQICASY